MKEVYYAPTAFEAHAIKDLLLANGIEAIVTNEGLTGAVGEIPPDLSTKPTVAIVDDDRLEEATAIIAGRDAAAPEDGSE